MRVGDRIVDRPSGYHGTVTNIYLDGGEEVSDVAVEEHDLIKTVVVKLDYAEGWAVLDISAGIEPLKPILH